MKQKSDVSYADLKQELDTVLARLQSEDVDIDEAVILYNRGGELIIELEQYLKHAQNTVTKLKVGLEKATKG